MLFFKKCSGIFMCKINKNNSENIVKIGILLIGGGEEYIIKYKDISDRRKQKEKCL